MTTQVTAAALAEQLEANASRRAEIGSRIAALDMEIEDLDGKRARVTAGGGDAAEIRRASREFEDERDDLRRAADHLDAERQRLETEHTNAARVEADAEYSAALAAAEEAVADLKAKLERLADRVVAPGMAEIDRRFEAARQARARSWRLRPPGETYDSRIGDPEMVWTRHAPVLPVARYLQALHEGRAVSVRTPAAPAEPPSGPLALR